MDTSAEPAFRWVRRFASLLAAGGTLTIAVFAASPLVFWCCGGFSAHTQRLLVSVAFVLIVAVGAFMAAMVAERDDRWFAYLLSAAIVGFGFLGIAFSSVESGEVALVENLILVFGGVVATWGGYLVALPFHKSTQA